MPLRFAVNPSKAVEALAYVGSVHPNLSQKYLAKIFYFAEKWHLSRYGRPIIADTYVAMPQGPVPSTIRDLVRQNWDWLDKPENFDDCIQISDDRGLMRVSAKDTATFDRLSNTDKACLEEAINYCANMTPDELSNVTHLERAWYEADRNRYMDYELFIDEDLENREEIVEMAREAAAVAVI
jgi:uncharacterized phage-associated protein